MTNSDRPNFYIYESADGWRKTDAKLTAELNKLFTSGPASTAGRSFYPQWPEPAYKSETKTAWFIDADGTAKVRTYWRIRDHEPQKHGNRCARIDEKRCAFRCPHKLAWNADKKLWTLIETTNEATKDEAARLSKQ